MCFQLISLLENTEIYYSEKKTSDLCISTKQGNQVNSLQRWQQHLHQGEGEPDKLRARTQEDSCTVVCC